MEMSDFNQSYESLNTLIQEYSELEKQLYNPPPPEPRLQILTWYTIYEHEFVLLRILVVHICYMSFVLLRIVQDTYTLYHYSGQSLYISLSV